jgi:hypothetical protein
LFNNNTISKEQIDYIIRLGKHLEVQEKERHLIELEEQIARHHRELEEVRKIGDKLREVKDQSKTLKEIRHGMKEYRYNKEHPDPPVDLGNGKMLVTLWKALPKELD